MTDLVDGTGGGKQIVFNSNGRQRSPHHRTHYLYPTLNLLPAGARLVLEPPLNSAQRIDPRLRTPSTLAKQEVCMYTYSQVDDGKPRDPLCENLPTEESLWQAMARVSQWPGTTVLQMVIYSTSQMPHLDNTFVLVERRTCIRQDEGLQTIQYRFSLRDWISVDEHLSSQQWYKELECLRLRKTERAFWHVQWFISHYNLIDINYAWFDIDVFGDENYLNIVWWRHPGRIDAVNESMSTFPIQELGRDEHDRRCPICMEPYDTSRDPHGSQPGPSGAGETPVRLPCRCGRPCGETCLKQWLLREGPSQCPSCRDSANIPVFYSPYDGGWCRRQPHLHQVEFHNSSALDCLPEELSDLIEVVVQKDLAQKVKVLLANDYLYSKPERSDNVDESWHFVLTDPEPQYHFGRDKWIAELAQDGLLSIVSQTADQRLRTSQGELYDMYLLHVDKYMQARIDTSTLPIDEQMSPGEAMEYYLEPVVIEWIKRMCIRATQLAVRAYAKPGLFAMDDGSHAYDAGGVARIRFEEDEEMNGYEEGEVEDEEEDDSDWGSLEIDVEITLDGLSSNPELRAAQRETATFFDSWAEPGPTTFGAPSESWNDFVRRVFVIRFGEQVLDADGHLDRQAMKNVMETIAPQGASTDLLHEDPILRLLWFELYSPGVASLGGQLSSLHWYSSGENSMGHEH